MKYPHTAEFHTIATLRNMMAGHEIVSGLVGRYNGPPWPHPLCLSRLATQDAAYCLDAPDAIPAGGFYSDEDGDGDALPMPLLLDREPRTKSTHR